VTFIVKGEVDRKCTNGAGVEALAHPASLGRLQSHVLAEAGVEAEGEREAAPHAFSLLEASSCRLHIQQDLRPVVVGQGHASHQPEDRETDGLVGGGGGQRGTVQQTDTDPGITSFCPLWMRYEQR